MAGKGKRRCGFGAMRRKRGGSGFIIRRIMQSLKRIETAIAKSHRRRERGEKSCKAAVVRGRKRFECLALEPWWNFGKRDLDVTWI